jgi:hypothetical protein
VTPNHILPPWFVLFFRTVLCFLCIVWVLLTFGLVSAADPYSDSPISQGELLKVVQNQAQGWDAFIDEVREKSLQRIEDLPNFICAQITRRYFEPTGGGRWQAQDILEAELTFNQNKESYANVTVNGRPSTKSFESLGGAISVGEFGSILATLFIPQTQAVFRKEAEEVVRGMKTVMIGFSVSQENSSWSLTFENSHSLKVPYRGTVWVDVRNREVLKVSLNTTQLPSNFPISYAETTTEYGYGSIAGIEGEQFLLPLRAKLIMRETRQRTSSRNEIEFRNFRKFTSDVKLVPDEQSPSEKSPSQKTR